VVIYQNKNGGDLREKKHLLKILEIENYIQKLPDWKDICYTVDDGDQPACAPGKSFVSPLIFLQYTSKRDTKGKPVSLEDLTQADIDEAWTNFYKKD